MTPTPQYMRRFEYTKGKKKCFIHLNKRSTTPQNYKMQYGTIPGDWCVDYMERPYLTHCVQTVSQTWRCSTTRSLTWRAHNWMNFHSQPQGTWVHCLKSMYFSAEDTKSSNIYSLCQLIDLLIWTSEISIQFIFTSIPRLYMNCSSGTLLSTAATCRSTGLPIQRSHSSEKPRKNIEPISNNAVSM